MRHVTDVFHQTANVSLCLKTSARDLRLISLQPTLPAHLLNAFNLPFVSCHIGIEVHCKLIVYHSVTCIITARFLLDLRSVQTTGKVDTQVVSHTRSEVIGTISWVVAAARDVVDDFDVASPTVTLEEACECVHELRETDGASVSGSGAMSQVGVLGQIV